MNLENLMKEFARHYESSPYVFPLVGSFHVLHHVEIEKIKMPLEVKEKSISHQSGDCKLNCVSKI